MLHRTDLVPRYAVADRTTPHLRANMIVSLDGAATRDGRAGGLGNADDQLLLRTLRMLADVLVVGAGTLRAEGYGALRVDDDAVAWRLAQGLPAHPVLAAVSDRLALDPAAPLFTDAPARPLVLTHRGAPADRRRALQEVAEVVDCGQDAVEPARLRAALVERGLPQMLCEGGPSLLGTLVAADAVDELCLTVAPVLEGGAAGRVAVGPAAPPVPMRLGHVLPAGDMLMLRYLRAGVAPRRPEERAAVAAGVP